MDVGMIGVGKLGLPVAVAMAEKGHRVRAYDINKKTLENYKNGKTNLYEPDIDNRLQQVIRNERISFHDILEEAVKPSEIVFISVQTPHPPELDGSIRFNHVRKDFDYSFLIKACCDIGKIIDTCNDYKVVSIISTVLPGTTTGIIYPEMQKHCKQLGHGWGLCYNPSFIAMGQTISDFVNPEFTLIGENQRNSTAGDVLEKFYKTIHNAPILRMTWTEAEGTKVWYNLYITQKINFANTVMHLCDKLGANCDVISDAFSKAWDRITSGKYLRGGGLDGGGCHCRDNLAMSYISDELELGYNLFDYAMTIREKHAEWFADEIQKAMNSSNQQVIIMGKTYKFGTNLIDGSPSILLWNILKERNIPAMFYDPETNPEHPAQVPSVYFIGTNWPEFRLFNYAPHSVVIDPWGMITEVPPDVHLISLGRRTRNKK